MLTLEYSYPRGVGESKGVHTSNGKKQNNVRTYVQVTRTYPNIFYGRLTRGTAEEPPPCPFSYRRLDDPPDIVVQQIRQDFEQLLIARLRTGPIQA